ncbi:LOW QUALITY PROTEIN: squamosa promoter-binding-like protein 14 [Rhodamnia argentea]|uniref:LOW QUALITY PROTEIN: squamosa promoter-binding-like protein 14 n=1 Tax=Rhodamnia argentea TaxID=178133 RepID=A0A8B8NX42_9MYRT|nr:LOW QUALITY PROTEIN: squamosa promoter-binding-like protein 14 [Rhodamnia argentea]
MEEVGAQVAAPMYVHSALSTKYCEAPPMAKKRDYLYNQYQPEQIQQQIPRLQDLRDNWNPSSWNWDNVRFVAKPLELEILRPGMAAADHKKKERANGLEKNGAGDEEDENLRLNLGGGLKYVEELVSRPQKRVRSGSPGCNYPMCQVDDCGEDLSNAKDYHRRHKVCELHSKSAKALVGKQMQRFCQQCSRFHPLSEFDEGKRSCRRRLAGHNRRRRKTQAEDVNSRPLVQGNRESTAHDNLDIVNLLASLARIQGKTDERSVNNMSVPDKEHIVKILSKMNSLTLPRDLAARLSTFKNLNGAVVGQTSSKHQDGSNRDMSSPSTMDLLQVFSATLGSSAPNALSALSQGSSQSGDSDRTKLKSPDLSTGAVMQRVTVDLASVGAERSSSSYQSPVEDSDCQIQETRPNLPLQLFSSSPEDDSPPKLATSRRYYSSDSSNPTEERSPLSSPPLVQKLFPMRTLKEAIETEKMSTSTEINGSVELTRNCVHTVPLELFRDSDKGPDCGPYQSSPYQTGYTSSSGSDHSPSSLTLDSQDRTGRIMFKLFDKDPSHFPMALRSQIFSWLSNSPLEMESYIRPGCVVLSIYLSMSSAAWEHLEGNLLQHLQSLVQNLDTDFWRSGRFLVHTGNKLASHNEGKLHLCRYWKTCSPELVSVSPLAIVGGQETSLLLRGRNLDNPGTKIHLTYKGGYISKEVTQVSSQGTLDEITVGAFKIDAGLPNAFSRCFIEVENGFKGNIFPVIVADAKICKELRLLESELEEEPRSRDVSPEEGNQDSGCQGSTRAEILHFLNELGWLFQRNTNSSMLRDPDSSLRRYKYLFIFAVERDCCALVKTLLDISISSYLDGDGQSSEPVGALLEIQLLNRAVRRKCRKMVDLLLHYPISSSKDYCKTYIFTPNMVGPGGITPLHVAACTSGSVDIVNALTNDPQEIGLNSWNSLLDANGQSPYSYAVMRNNLSYNELVSCKLADRKNSQISVIIGNEMEESQPSVVQEPGQRAQSQLSAGSCTRCAVAATKYGRRFPVSHGVLHRPYIHSMLVVAAVCVCVCLIFRGGPQVGNPPFNWEHLGYGAI